MILNTENLELIKKNMEMLFPSKPSLEDVVSKMSTDELKGIYLFGSKTGKRLSKEELLKRGVLRKLNWFTKLFMYPFIK